MHEPVPFPGKSCIEIGARNPAACRGQRGSACDEISNPMGYIHCLSTRQPFRMRPTSPYTASFLLTGLLIVLTVVFRNYEFLLYAVTVSVLVVLLYATDRYFEFDRIALWLFNAWLVMHSLGGLASYGDVRLYDLILIDLVGAPYHILKYDQFVHFYCYLVIAMLMSSVVHKIARPEASAVAVSVVTILAASSLGAVNEIVEFLAVVVTGTQGVGGYTNTAIDLVANLLGAITGTLLLQAVRYKT